MAKTAGGGLTYLIGKLVAGFLSFLLGPAIGGAVFGFFLGMLVGLFEDLSIFLQIGDIAKAITQLPGMIAQLAGNPSMLVALFVDMITAHMTRCMLVNPYGRPDGTTDQWANWVAQRFFGQEPGGPDNRIVFGVACTVGSIVGYLVQQFLIGTGIAKVLGKMSELGKFAKLGKKLSDGAGALGKTVGRAADVAKGAVQKFTRGAGEAANRFLERVGLKRSDEFADSLTHCVIRMGSTNSCNRPDLHKVFGDAQVDDMLRREKLRKLSGLDEFPLDQQTHVLRTHTGRYDILPGETPAGKLFPGHWSDKRVLDAISDAADNGARRAGRGGTIWAEKVIDGYLIRAVISQGQKIITGRVV